MTETEKPSPSELVLVPENIPEARRLIAGLRERDDTQEKALAEIHKWRKASIEWEKYEDAVDLYWEEYLIGKHFLMRSRDDTSLGKIEKARLAARGFAIMSRMNSQANSYIEDNKVVYKKPRSYRFSGELAMLTKRPGLAAKQFETGVNLFKAADSFDQRVNALELSGFLAEAMVLSGKVDEGIMTAKETFSAYDIGDGAELRDRDYYTWAVWKSGCATKLCNAVLKKSALSSQNKETLTNMIRTADEITVFPNGQETWGDKSFGIRKREIASIKSRLKLD